MKLQVMKLPVIGLLATGLQVIRLQQEQAARGRLLEEPGL